jgi:hypothetical protein
MTRCSRGLPAKQTMHLVEDERAHVDLLQEPNRPCLKAASVAIDAEMSSMEVNSSTCAESTPSACRVGSPFLN